MFRWRSSLTPPVGPTPRCRRSEVGAKTDRALRTNYFHGFGQQLVLSFAHAANRPGRLDGRLNADAVVLRAIVLEHAHAGPDDSVAARQAHGVDVAVGSRRRAADDISQLVVLDDPQVGLGVA